MDDAWLATLTAPPTTSRAKPQQKRRASLLEQPAEQKADVAIEAIQEANEEDNPWSGPAKASVSRRSQSYSDFYDVVNSYAKLNGQSRRRRSSVGSHEKIAHRGGVELDFDEEFTLLESELLEGSHQGYETYLDQLQLSSSHLGSLLGSTQDTLDLLSTLSGSFKSVESQTNAFRQQCESLITEQRRLEALADAVEENARYYTYLEPMTRRLNAPGAANLVKGNDFPEMLSNLDNCLAYMESHPKHKESETYRSRYRLLLTRALTLIRHHFTKSLGDIAADISKRVQGGQLKETTHSALLYAKFRVPAPELKTLGLEIQKRAVPTPDDVDAGREPEYMSLLRELYESYSAARGRLMLPLVSKKMAELAGTSQQADVLDFAKSSLSFLRGICLDEYELWFEWFETEGALHDFLESLTEPMFDYLRPKVIHETKLEKLCELCAMVQGRYMDTDSDDEDDDDLESAVSGPAPDGRTLGRKLDFGSLIQPGLQDAQTRLVFLAMNVLRDGIENYKPQPEDLEWPRKSSAPATNGSKAGPVLSGKRDTSSTNKKAPATVVEDADDGASMFSKQLTTKDGAPPAHNWYPTLPKAIWLLRRIYRLVNSTVFDDLAHRIVHSTIASLLYASNQVSSKKTTPDGQLFLITHLLHLKQQIVAFDIEFIPPEVEFDFSSYTNTFYELRERGNLWNPASWVRLVSGALGGGLLPKVVENMLDAKAELDGRLRTVINDFVNGHAQHITAPIEPTSISEAKTKQAFDALKAVRTVRGLAEKDVPAIRAKLMEFVDDARTRETLVAAVRDQVVMSYEDFFDAQSEGQTRRLSRKGKGREDEVWGPELFVEAMERVFQVGQMVGEDDGGSEGSGHVSD
ncbi:Golgi transport complex subunit 3 [Saxophila tyrrhenica]|uniref:Conserved oligomeric Golgi complex subunit 3 n=1 Tax=Saxophila tyrrhenica TaxID=1690608 RepID=A0AAV9PH25_9PEZI|nr:Golgi transport complex subunit 3 [Saxophila tyrrhenica]